MKKIYKKEFNFLKELKNNKKVTFIAIIIVIFTLAVGITYAYFSTILNVEGEPNTVITETGTLELSYDGGQEINAEHIYPGWEENKTVTIENTGSLDTFYSLNWKSLTNTIERDELVMSATCVSTEGTCEGIDSAPVGTTVGIIKKNIPIKSGTTHTYVITFSFLERNSEQNYNQGKDFIGAIIVNESLGLLTLNGVAVDINDNPLENARVEIHSDVITSTTDSKGMFSLSGIEEGNHTIYIYDSNNNLISEEDISVSRFGNNYTINENKLYLNSDDVISKIKFKINTTSRILSDMSVVVPPTITYNANGGTNVHGNTKSLTGWNTYGALDTPTRDHYTFVGWYTDINEGTKIRPTTALNNYDNHTVYARWYQSVGDFCEGENFAQCITENVVARDGLISINRSATELQNYTSTDYIYQGGFTCADLPLTQENCEYMGGIYNEANGSHYCASPSHTSYYNTSSIDDYGCDLFGGNLIGTNPKNYVNFNDELWRIVGVYKVRKDISSTPEFRIKIVRNSLMEKAFWTFRGTGLTNNWLTSSINTDLNERFLIPENKTSYYPALSLESNNFIDDTVWYLGNVAYDITPAQAYSQERTGTNNINTDFSASWIGKIGLLYPSDYGYASSECYNTKNMGNDATTGYNSTTCTGSDWINVSETSQYLLSPTIDLTCVQGVTYYGSVGCNSISNFGMMGFYGINYRPALYLKSSTILVSGKGTVNDPFILGLSE